ncbi:MAG: chorismate synthase [Flavobacteriales bacterium]|nr:chorismate synthase [Flavobacteriales bacterium]
MAGSSFGTIFKLSTFGESHGIAIGGVIDGVPANLELDFEVIQSELDKRKPGQSAIVTQRKESDKVQFLSGIFEGKTTGAPIGFIIPNENQKSNDYAHLKEAFRPSHADFTYQEKFGIRDYKGGGRSSARETASRVVAGAIAKQMLQSVGVRFSTYVDQIGKIQLNSADFYQSELIESNIIRCPDAQVAAEMEELIRTVRKDGDTIGGAIRCVIENVPIGLGEPVFDKLHAELGKAMLSINAVKGFEIGSGFEALTMRGSEHNDLFNTDGTTKTNHSGGIQGGISNGMPISFRVAFKPVATLMQSQESITIQGEAIELEGKGRHDACVVPRAVPIVEAMAAITILDFYLRNKSIHL